MMIPNHLPLPPDKYKSSSSSSNINHLPLPPTNTNHFPLPPDKYKSSSSSSNINHRPLPQDKYESSSSSSRQIQIIFLFLQTNTIIFFSLPKPLCLRWYIYIHVCIRESSNIGVSGQQKKQRKLHPHRPQPVRRPFKSYRYNKIVLLLILHRPELTWASYA